MSQSAHMMYGMTTDTVPEFTVLDRMVKAREVAGLNQDEIAALLGVSRSTVRRLENGSTMAKRGDLLAWAAVTGVSSEWLVSGTIATETLTAGYAFQATLPFELDLVA